MQAQSSDVKRPHNLSNLQWSVQSRLSGVQAVTVSAPDVLLQEATPEELEVEGP